jgi:hypothetical protein
MATLADRPELGRTAVPEEIAAWDINTGPESAGLPAGSGTQKKVRWSTPQSASLAMAKEDWANPTTSSSAGAGP